MALDWVSGIAITSQEAARAISQLCKCIQVWYTKQRNSVTCTCAHNI